MAKDKGFVIGTLPDDTHDAPEVRLEVRYDPARFNTDEIRERIMYATAHAYQELERREAENDGRS